MLICVCVTRESVWCIIIIIIIIIIIFLFYFYFTGECIWLHLDLIKEMHDFCKTLYPSVDYAYTTIPTYPSGQIGFILCSLNPVSIHSH